LNRLVSIFSRCSLRPNTSNTYACHQRSYVKLCGTLNTDPDEPLTEHRFCALIICYCLTHKITTLPAFISAIARYYEDNGWGELPRKLLFQRVRRGVLNFYGHLNQSVPKAAITVNDLLLFHSRLNHSSFSDARDWCAFLFAFFALLRVGEYTNGRLQLRDVQFNAFSDRVRLTIAFSKTQCYLVIIDISARSDVLCPRRALINYLTLLPATAHAHPRSPLFVISTSDLRPLSDVSFIARLRALMSVCRPGVDTSAYAGHSFRRGGATTLFLAGVPETIIQLHGRWKSVAYRAYFDANRNDAARLEATSQLRSIPLERLQALPGAANLPASIEREMD